MVPVWPGAARRRHHPTSSWSTRPRWPLPDPFALAELIDDVRPPDYATSFARQAAQLSGLPEPIAVTAMARPDWLRAVVDEPGVVVTSLDEALAIYGANANT